MTIYALQRPPALVTGPVGGRVLSFTLAHIVLALPRPGRYRLAVRFSPYWHSQTACIAAAPDGMIRLVARQAGLTELYFDVGFFRAVATVFGKTSSCL
jgi:hypothetical protein